MYILLAAQSALLLVSCPLRNLVLMHPISAMPQTTREGSGPHIHSETL